MNPSTRRLRPVLAAFFLLAALLPLRAANWQYITIEGVAGGLWFHALGNPELGSYDAAYRDLYEAGSGGQMAMRMTRLFDLDKPVTLYDFSGGQSLILGLIGEGVTGTGGAQWTNPSGPLVQFFVLPWELRDHAFALVHPGGTTYPVTKLPGGGDYPSVGGITYAGSFEGAALCTPGEEFWLVDLQTNSRSPTGETLLLGASWVSNPGPVPLIPVMLSLESHEDGYLFTVSSHAADGPVMTQSVQASGNSAGATLNFAVGSGMEFWLTRDADVPPIESPHFVADGDFSGYGSLSGVFPATPQHPQEAQTFRIHAQRWGHAFTVWQSDGTHFPFIAPDTADGPAYAAETIADWNDQGLSNPLGILTFTAQVDPTRVWWLRDDSTGEAFPAMQTDVLDGWVPLHTQPPASLTVTLHLHYLRAGHRFQLFAPASSPGAGETALSEVFYGDLGYGTVTTDTGSGLDGMADYPLWTVQCDILNPTPFSAGPFLLRDTDADGGPAQVWAGDNDLPHWFGSPQPLQLTISTSRWDHELLLRHPDGTAYPVFKFQTQGDVSFDPQGNA